LRRPNLTAERERRLLHDCLAGRDETTRQQALSELRESHTKLVVAIARQFHRPGLSMNELVAAGHLGLRAAIESFDPDRPGTRLSSYAAGWIRDHIQDHIRRNVPRGEAPDSAAQEQLLRAANRLLADARRSCQREGVEPTDAELCARVGARIGLAAEQVARSLGLGGGDAATAGEVPAEPAPREGAEILRPDQARLRRRVQALTEQILGERERKVFLACSVADSSRARARDSLASELGVTRERVYQLEASARRNIAAALAHDGIPEPEPPPEPRGTRAARRRTAAAVT
jgi:RNA polymerase sigma factor (sigma-70 family)